MPTTSFIINHVYYGNIRCIIPQYVVYMAYSSSDAHRALELLEDYHSRLTQPQDKQLKIAIERVIKIFKSKLFQALLGK